MSKPTNPPVKLRFVLRDEVPEYGSKTPLDTPEKIYEFFRSVIRTDESFEPSKEHVFVIAVDTRLRLIGYNVVSVGTVSETNAHPREILRPVIIAAAHGFVLLHNHPSGDASPSRADEIVTRRIVEAAGLMQLHLLDHVICGKPSPGRTGYYSFREAGMIP